MSKFNVGDKVKVVTPRGTFARPLLGRDGEVVESGGTGGVLVRYGTLRYYLFDDELELVSEDFEAKYNALVADLVQLFRNSNTAAVNNYIATHLMPKPKQYDVTVRVGERNGVNYGPTVRVGDKTAEGYEVLSVTEVTE